MSHELSKTPASKNDVGQNATILTGAWINTEPINEENVQELKDWFAPKHECELGEPVWDAFVVTQNSIAELRLIHYMPFSLTSCRPVGAAYSYEVLLQLPSGQSLSSIMDYSVSVVADVNTDSDGKADDIAIQLVRSDGNVIYLTVHEAHDQMHRLIALQLGLAAIGPAPK